MSLFSTLIEFICYQACVWWKRSGHNHSSKCTLFPWHCDEESQRKDQAEWTKSPPSTSVCVSEWRKYSCGHHPPEKTQVNASFFTLPILSFCAPTEMISRLSWRTWGFQPSPLLHRPIGAILECVWRKSGSQFSQWILIQWIISARVEKMALTLI